MLIKDMSMIRKKLLFSALLLMFSMGSFAQVDTVRHEVLLSTTMGDIKVVLYNETPKHRDNFLKLVKKGVYNGVLFHRVIKNFMIQSGDSTSRHAKPGEVTGNHTLPYVIPAEIVFPKCFHKRGALAAAREPDEVNPKYDSSPCQFYIVYGHVYNEPTLDVVQERISKRTQGAVVLPPEVRSVYCEQGGTPSLDGKYTVFGEVIEGLDIVEKIQGVATDANSRPLEDVRIIKAKIIK
jgi:cyclophilin family peptidyl-prolyl cis-trans isomerase